MKINKIKKVNYLKAPLFQGRKKQISVADRKQADVYSNDALDSYGRALVKSRNAEEQNVNVLTLCEIAMNDYYKKLGCHDERKEKYYDEAVETAFHIYRHWFQFTVPKAFRVVDSIQRLICERRHIKSTTMYLWLIFLTTS